ncbi:par-3 family cell polarity regulator beta a [Lampris incognitus]|uniref:par-3 family cell polarity regulator beta a n=1 Tax=Lampris incognitus TaxID=2546036 RepID=UPI0024B480F3|nr:par-3 family cell polarity regulator beta a [Lampris incognitus]
MKVTVTFGNTGVVVPCKAGWTVRDLIDQATRRYRKILEQDGEWSVRTHRMEYCEGGILDMDDLLSDLVEDRDKLVAVFEEVHSGKTSGKTSPGSSISNGHSSPAPSPEPVQYNSHPLTQQPMGGEIEVNEAVLKANSLLLVRSSSDPALASTLETNATSKPEDHGGGAPEQDVNHAQRGALDRLHADHQPAAKMSRFNISIRPPTAQVECLCLFVFVNGMLKWKGEDAGSTLWEDGRERLMYEIPLNDSGSAGLGVSLKGNKSRETGEDLGIFIKSVIHGGAAYKDGRLRVNDQLIGVNGESLLGLSNHAAMETLRHSMSSEGNARGTIQLVLLRAAMQTSSGNSGPSAANTSTALQPSLQAGSSNQEFQEPVAHQPRGLGSPSVYRGPSGPSKPTHVEVNSNSARQAAVMTDGYLHSSSGRAVHNAATTNGVHGGYDDDFEEDLQEDFPPPPSPGAVAEMNRELSLTPQHHSDLEGMPYTAEALHEDRSMDRLTDNIPRNRASKSMDLVADESNVGSLVRQWPEPSAGGALGPTLGLVKSSSLESLQTAVSEARQNQVQTAVPFHRPRPHMVRGRGCNQSFRIAIDKSYEGPSEDDDDLSEQSSGRDTPASGSSRQGLDMEDGKKKKTKGKKKEKKTKGKKKGDESTEELEKKTKKRGFGLLRFGKKKEEKSKEANKASKNKLEAVSEEELDRTADNRSEQRPRDIRSGQLTPDPASLPDLEDDDSDPNYARINTFRQPPSPQPLSSRTPSPGTVGRAAVAGGLPQHTAAHQSRQPSAEELDGLYAKVNKQRAPAAQHHSSPSQHQTPADGEQRVQLMRRELQQARIAPSYEELDAAHRRALEYDPHRMVPRGADARHAPRYEEVDRHYATHPRRANPYDYPRAMAREPAPYPGNYPGHEPPAPGRPPIPYPGSSSQQVPLDPRYYPSSPRPPGQEQQHRAALRQDMPPSPTAAHRGRPRYETTGRRRDGHRQASPGRYTSPERYPVGTQRYASPEHFNYRDERRPDPRQKNPMIGAV